MNILYAAQVCMLCMKVTNNLSDPGTLAVCALLLQLHFVLKQAEVGPSFTTQLSWSWPGINCFLHWFVLFYFSPLHFLTELPLIQRQWGQQGFTQSLLRHITDGLERQERRQFWKEKGIFYVSLSLLMAFFGAYPCFHASLSYFLQLLSSLHQFSIPFFFMWSTWCMWFLCCCCHSTYYTFPIFDSPEWQLLMENSSHCFHFFLSFIAVDFRGVGYPLCT